MIQNKGYEGVRDNIVFVMYFNNIIRTFNHLNVTRYLHRNTLNILLAETKDKRSRYRWEDNIKVLKQLIN